MKNIFISFLALALLVLALNNGIAKQASPNDEIDKSLPTIAAGSVKIDIVSGRVNVQSWDKSEVRVKGRLDSNTKRFVFDAEDEGEVIIKVELKKRWFNFSRKSNGTDLTIFIPQQNALFVDNVSSDYTVVGTQGGVKISSVSGDFEMRDIGGNIDIDSVSGDINLVASESEQPIDFKLDSVSGDLNANLAKLRRAEMDSVSGDLNLKMLLAENGRIGADTISGDVNLTFKNNAVNPAIDVDTGMGGDLINELGASSSSDNTNGKISIDTVSGDIVLRRVSSH